MTARLCLFAALFVFGTMGVAAASPLPTATLWNGVKLTPVPPGVLVGVVAVDSVHTARPLSSGEISRPAGTRVVIVVRHAETVNDGSSDPPLSAAGLQRAVALARIAVAHDVEAAFATPFRRTLGTAGVAAEWLGLRAEAVPIPAGGIPAHVADVVARVQAANGAGVLVVGHSNTVPAIVQALTGISVGPIAETEYNRLFVVTLPAEGPPTVDERSY